MSKIAVIVPTHNEPDTDTVIAQIRSEIGCSDEIVVFNDAEGRGKGFALREGLKRAGNADYYIFIDGDRDISPKYINSILFFLKRYDVVVGKKQLPKRWDRKILTFLSRIWIWLLFGIEVDTQTGIKGFNYKPSWELDGWAFDIEVLWQAKKDGKTMIQVPVEATVSSGKTMKDIMSCFWDTIKIRWGI